MNGHHAFDKQETKITLWISKVGLIIRARMLEYIKQANKCTSLGQRGSYAGHA